MSSVNRKGKQKKAGLQTSLHHNRDQLTASSNEEIPRLTGEGSDDSTDEPNWKVILMSYFTLVNLLKLVIWISLMAFFVEIQFGSVFLIVSMFYFVIVNTSTGGRKDGQLSPYSVFNPDYKVIDGTFTAEQFERELRLKRY